ncbi:protein kinase [Streptomyces sp. ID05-04B]|uniref:protein kinase domain-containing protein n=1 Tax=Streptomyces sp. ID05-04B TaxID=3028661 RepID=UPI0029C4B79C|nr:protein kinase [Streptomyces sp. ID05-04B]MDX5566439.1 protein kinase [Streptomyces sp. ID05-04B]
MSATPSEAFADVLLEELNGRTTPEGRRHLLETVDESVMTAATVAVLRDILDHITDYDFERTDNSKFSDACRTARLRLLDEPDGPTAPVIGFVSLISLNVTLLARRFESPDAEKQRLADLYAGSLFPDLAIGRAIELVYGPVGHPATTSGEAGFWSTIDFSSLEYHKAGTTSFILRGYKRIPDNEAGARSALAVKCVLFPWNKLSAISKATDQYAQRYGAEAVSPQVVKPTASSGQWVLMPFQEGKTLGESLAEFEAGTPGMAARIAMAEYVADKITNALHELSCRQPIFEADPQRQHLDLSPNNIIIDPQGNAKLIDLGINHLYSRQVGIAEHDDAVYVAPEIKNNKKASQTADVYSLGIILMQILASTPPRDGRTPEIIWSTSPNLGRLLEDLIEERPERRLLAMPHEPGLRYDVLRQRLAFCFELVRQEPVAGESAAKYLAARIAPTSREFSTQFEQWRQWRDESAFRGAYDRYLLFFTALSSLAWWFIVSKTALATAADIVVGEAEGLPAGSELHAKVIALSQGLVAAKFYQTVLARVTTRGIPGFRARCTEVAMRSMALVAVPTTVLSTFSPEWYWVWPWTCAGGAVAVALTNWAVWATANDLLDKSQKILSTAPDASRRFARGYEQWWWTMLLYAMIIATIGAGVQAGRLKDTSAYVFILVVITLGVHYGTKCAAAGPAVGGSIARAFSAGQRMEKLRNRGII